MTRTIRQTGTLFYYDGPQVFEALDAIGGHYLGVMVAPDDARDRYLVVGADPDRLRQFRLGLIDLRTMIMDRPYGEWFMLHVDSGLDGDLGLEVIADPDIADDLLPVAGFQLQQTSTSSVAGIEARARGNLVLEITLTPPESAREHRIHVPTYVKALGLLQTIVKHAFGWALRDTPQNSRSSVRRENAHILDVVVPAEAGSFKLILVGSQEPDMFGNNEIARALVQLDQLFDHVSDPVEAAKYAQTRRGHLAGAYLRLLEFLVAHDTDIQYEWAEPLSTHTQRRGISINQAKPIIAILSTVQDLGSETVILTGALTKADVANGAWRLLTSEGEFAGRTAENGPGLGGLKIESRYTFTCTEEMSEVQTSGTETRLLLLMKHEPA